MSDLSRVKKMAKALAKKQVEVKALDQKLKEEKKLLRTLEEEDLPELMMEIGLKEITLEDGSKITLVQDCDAAITEATRKGALEWLLKNNFGGLIKTQIDIKFDRGDHETAEEVYKELGKKYQGVELKEVVHPSTLKSFVKERMAAAQSIPMKLFNVRSYNKAKVKAK